MRIGVVLPTIRGRENLLERTQQAYQASSDHELVIVIPRDASCVGDAWNAGARALKEHECDFLHLSADDLIPAPTWADAAIGAAENGIYPSPRLTRQNGALESCGTLGGGFYLPEVRTGSPAGASGAPFFSFDLWERIEPVPSIHYYCDDFVAYMARSEGLICQVVREYHFMHLEGTAGRPAVVAKAEEHRTAMLTEIARRFSAETVTAGAE